MENELHFQATAQHLNKVSYVLEGLYSQKELILQHKTEVQKNPSKYPSDELHRIEIVTSKKKKKKLIVSNNISLEIKRHNKSN